MENENIGNRPEGCESDSSSSDFSPSNDTFCNGDCFPSKDSADTSTEDSMSEESESADSSTDSASSEYSSSDEGNEEGLSTSGVKCDNSAKSGPPCYTSDSDDSSESSSTCESGESESLSPSTHFLYYDRAAYSDSLEEANDEDEEYNETSGAAAGGELRTVYGQEPNYEELSTEDIDATELNDSIAYSNFLLEFTERYGDQLQGSSLEINAKNSWKLLHYSERMQYQIEAYDNNKDVLQPIDGIDESNSSMPESLASTYDYDWVDTDPDLFKDIVFMEVYRNYFLIYRKFFCWFMPGAALLQNALENWYWMTLEERSEFEQEKLKSKKSFEFSKKNFEADVNQLEDKPDNDSLLEISEDEDNAEPQAKRARFEELP